MPIFDYKCDKCKVVKEKLVTRKDADENIEFECDCADKGTLKRTDVPSAAALRFKGNWFGTTGRY